MMKFCIIKRCKCKSVLEVETEDINIDTYIINNKLKCYFSYCCPVCFNKNYLILKELPKQIIIEKLVKLKASL